MIGIVEIAKTDAIWHTCPQIANNIQQIVLNFNPNCISILPIPAKVLEILTNCCNHYQLVIITIWIIHSKSPFVKGFFCFCRTHLAAALAFLWYYFNIICCIFQNFCTLLRNSTYSVNYLWIPPLSDWQKLSIRYTELASGEKAAEISIKRGNLLWQTDLYWMRPVTMAPVRSGDRRWSERPRVQKVLCVLRPGPD